jgi:hypothetical protein
MRVTLSDNLRNQYHRFDLLELNLVYEMLLLGIEAERPVKIVLKRHVSWCTKGFSIVEVDIMGINLHFLVITHDMVNYEGL